MPRWPDSLTGGALNLRITGVMVQISFRPEFFMPYLGISFKLVAHLTWWSRQITKTEF